MFRKMYAMSIRKNCQGNWLNISMLSISKGVDLTHFETGYQMGTGFHRVHKSIYIADALKKIMKNVASFIKPFKDVARVAKDWFDACDAPHEMRTNETQPICLQQHMTSLTRHWIPRVANLFIARGGGEDRKHKKPRTPIPSIHHTSMTLPRVTSLG